MIVGYCRAAFQYVGQQGRLSDMRKLDKNAKDEAARLSIRVPGDLLAQIEKQAEVERRTVGQMVRILLEDRLAELQKER
jgi:hypothetical protein